MDGYFALLVASLFCFRLAYMLVFEEGMFGVAEQIRKFAGVYTAKTQVFNQLGQPIEVDAAVSDNWIGKGLTCFNCTSVWVGAVIALLMPDYPTDPAFMVLRWAIYVLAISGGAMLIKGLSQ